MVTSVIKQFTSWLYGCFCRSFLAAKGYVRKIGSTRFMQRSQRLFKNTATPLQNASILSGEPSLKASENKITYTLDRSEVVETLNKILYEPGRLPSQKTYPNPTDSGSTAQNVPLSNSAFASVNIPRAHTLEELADSAFLCEKQGRLGEAERLYKQVILLSHQQMGQSHPSVASSFSDLAALYQSQKRYDEAELLLRKALKIRLQCLLGNHPDIAENCYQLACIYRYQHQYSKAELLFQCALSIFRQQLGSEHPRTKSVYDALMHMLATVIKTGRYDEIVKDLPPLDLDNLSDRYPWARPNWHQ